jgi:hypothetical protein
MFESNCNLFLQLVASVPMASSPNLWGEMPPTDFYKFKFLVLFLFLFSKFFYLCNRYITVLPEHNHISYNCNTVNTQTYSEKCGISPRITVFEMKALRHSDISRALGCQFLNTLWYSSPIFWLGIVTPVSDTRMVIMQSKQPPTTTQTRERETEREREREREFFSFRVVNNWNNLPARYQASAAK